MRRGGFFRYKENYYKFTSSRAEGFSYLFSQPPPRDITSDTWPIVSFVAFFTSMPGESCFFRVIEVGAHCEACRFGGNFVVVIVEHAVVGFIFVHEEAQAYRGAGAPALMSILLKRPQSRYATTSRSLSSKYA